MEKGREEGTTSQNFAKIFFRMLIILTKFKIIYSSIKFYNIQFLIFIIVNFYYKNRLKSVV